MRIINLTLNKQEDIFDKYNNKKVSKQLLNYIIETALETPTTNYKIVINTELKDEFEKIIKEGLKQELEFNLHEKSLTNLKQIYLIFLGSIFIGLSIYLKNFEIWHELILILGWVPIWETMNIELFTDSKARKKRNTIKKLLNSKFEIESINK